MSRKPVVLSLVERGWQAARECALDIKHENVIVVHVIKGYFSGARALVIPTAGERIMSIPRVLFWPVVWVCIGVLACAGRLRSLLVDNDRSGRRLFAIARSLGIGLVLLRLGTQGYELWCGDRRMPEAEWLRALKE